MIKTSTPGIMRKIKEYRRLIAFVTIVALMPLALSCYGTFPLTRAVYRANGNVYGSVEGDRTQRKLAQSAVFWLFAPVYLGAGLGDAFVLNVIEFWTGKTTEVSMKKELDGTTVTLASSKNGNEAWLTVSQGGKILGQERFIRIDDSTVEVRDQHNHVVGKIRQQDDGSLNMTDKSGEAIQVISPQELKSIQKF